jgi:hypothetical protein
MQLSSHLILYLKILMMVYYTHWFQFDIPQIKAFSFNCIFHDIKPIISVLNFLHLRFSQVQFSNPLFHKESVNGSFIVLINVLTLLDSW